MLPSANVSPVSGLRISTTGGVVSDAQIAELTLMVSCVAQVGLHQGDRQRRGKRDPGAKTRPGPGASPGRGPPEDIVAGLQLLGGKVDPAAAGTRRLDAALVVQRRFDADDGQNLDGNRDVGVDAYCAEERRRRR